MKRLPARFLPEATFSLLSVSSLFFTFTDAHEGHIHSSEEADSEAPTLSPLNIRRSRLTSNIVGALVVFFLVPFLSCWVTRVVNINADLLKYGVLFAAGLFFSLSVEHLLADAVDGLSSLTTDTFPYAYMLLVAGYFLTWLSDIVARAVWELQEEKKRRRPIGQFEVGAVPMLCCKSSGVADEESGALKDVKAVKCSGVNCQCDGLDCGCSSPSGLEFIEADELARAGPAVSAAVGGGTGVDGGRSAAQLALVDILLLVLALCFHAVFDGLAVGQTSTVFKVWDVSVSVIIHKVFEGLALGATLVAQDSTRSLLSFALYAAAFSIMSPVGIAIGISLDRVTEPLAAAWVDSIGNGLAAGVLVFVAVGHLMVRSMKPGPKDRWWTPLPKWGAAALGFITSTLLQLKDN